MERNSKASSGVWQMIKQAAADFSSDNVMRLSAALAYYTIFSLAPLLVISVVVLKVFLSDAPGLIEHQLELLMGQPGKDAAVQMLSSAKQHGSGWFATITSIIILFVGASGVFGELQSSMNTIWGIRAKPDRGWWIYIRSRFLSMAMVLGVIFLLLVSLVISAVFSAIVKRLTVEQSVLSHAADFVVSLIGITLLIALIFKFLPDAKIAWRDVWAGAGLTAVLFSIGKIALGYYLGWSSTASAYGAAGSLAALLIWIYYSAAIIFFGAELTQVWAERRGADIEPAPYAETIAPSKKNTENEDRRWKRDDQEHTASDGLAADRTSSKTHH